MGDTGPEVLAQFSAPTRAWFTDTFTAPTHAQAKAWWSITSGEHTAVIAPTGSGKTLAAFLWAIDNLLTAPQPPERARRCRVLYISPLKALAADIQRNLRAPLAGITAAAQHESASVNEVTVGMRTGDTPAAERRRFATHPPDVLITTPESLYLMLTSAAREGLRGVEQVIVDEVHVLAGSKRGAHLALSLERLDELLERPAQRIGLSATIRPPEVVTTYLAGNRPVAEGGRPARVVSALRADSSEAAGAAGSSDAPESADAPGAAGAAGSGNGEDLTAHSEALLPAPAVDIDVVVPVPDLTDIAGTAPVPHGEPPPEGGAGSIWSHVTEMVLDLITRHTSTIVFTNSRRSCERLAARLNEAHAVRRGWPAPDPGAQWPAEAPAQSGTAAARPEELEDSILIARAHHGSMSRQERTDIEEALKAGTLPAVIATSSLELGIDMGTVDLVVQVGAPPSVAATLQRIGRADHQVGGTSRGVVLPTHRGDLLTAAVTSRRAGLGQIERSRLLTNPLDVLAQQIVAMCAVEDRDVPGLAAVVRRAAPFASLSHRLLHSVLDMLTGHYPSEEFAQLKPILTWQRSTGVLSARRGARLRATLSGGTIPDRGLYGVHIAGASSSARGSTRVGELDEEMVHESRPGDTFTLGSSTWRIEEIDTDRVLVSPAPGLPGRLPFWTGDTPGRPAELGRAIGAMVRTVQEQQFSAQSLAGWGLEKWARDNLLAYLRDQHRATGVLPTDRTLVVEQFRDELGDWRVVLHSPFGARIHAPWALLISDQLQRRYGIDASAMPTDDGIVLRLPGSGEADDLSGPGLQPADLLPDPEDVDQRVLQALHGSAQFAARFREAAARSLLLPRSRAGRRQPLWQQRLRSTQLLSVAAKYPQFPVMLEAVRECLQDDFDTAALGEVLQQVNRGQVEMVQVTTAKASPFAHSLLLGYVAQFVHGEDAPMAERRAAALSVDADLIGDLLGHGAQLADLLDPEAIEQVEAEVGLRTAVHQAGDAEQLVDHIRRLGPVDAAELRRRTAQPELLDRWLEELSEAGRIFVLAGRQEWVVVEDAATMRDGLGAELPNGLSTELLLPAPHALRDLTLRYARTHGPFRAGELAAHYDLPMAALTPILAELHSQGALVAGWLRPGAAHTPRSAALPGPDYCEADILRRIRRRSLQALRSAVQPVAQHQLATYIARHQHIGDRQPIELLDAIDQLAGAPVAASAWESLVLPQRVPGYTPQLLDELTSAGEVVWVGAGGGPGKDGLLSLLPADAVPELAPPAQELDDPLVQEVLAQLSTGGKFFAEISQELRDRPAGDAGDVAPDSEALVEALWRACWAGLITNDTLAPLRSRLGAPTRQGPRRRRRGYSMRALAWQASAARPTMLPEQAKGRWSLVPERAPQDRRAVVATAALLDRDGVVTRGSAAHYVPGGFAAAYRILAQLEEGGQVRRGYFVEGLGGAQFAAESAVDDLRGHDGSARTVLLAATDPANPYGAALDWPSSEHQQGGTHRPGRKVGAHVVLVDGVPVLYLEQGGRSLLSFSRDRAALFSAAEELVRVAQLGSLGRFTLIRIDGAPALGHTGAAATALQEAGFIAAPSGLRVRRR